MKRLLSILLAALLSAAAPAWAADGTVTAGILKPGEALRGKFLQERRLQGFDAPLKTEGSYLLSPASGLLWRAEKPFAVVTMINGDGLVQLANGQETLRLPAARLPFLSRLFAVFEGALLGDWRKLSDQFTVAQSGNERDWTLALTPLKNGDAEVMPISRINVSGGRFVQKVEIVRVNGDSDRITFSDQTVVQDKPTPDEIQLFSKVKTP